jgi:hypothetical protein
VDVDDICVAWRWMLERGKVAECRRAMASYSGSAMDGRGRTRNVSCWGRRSRATELLALAYHIVAPYSWERVGFAGGRELERALQEALPPDAYAAAQERGRARNVGETLSELLAEVEGSLLLDEVARAQEERRSIPGIIGQ